MYKCINISCFFFIVLYIFQTSLVTETDELEEEETTLEKLLSRVGLQDKESTFEQEQIDLDALVSILVAFQMCVHLIHIFIPQGLHASFQKIICSIKENNSVIYCALYIATCNTNIDCKILMFDQ